MGLIKEEFGQADGGSITHPLPLAVYAHSMAHLRQESIASGVHLSLGLVGTSTFAGRYWKKVQHSIPADLTDNLKSKDQDKDDQGVFHIPAVHREANMLVYFR
jgi:hypothetical protein